MNTDNCAKFNHYKPPYEYTPKFRCGGVYKACRKPCPAPLMPCKPEPEPAPECECKPKPKCSPEQQDGPGLLKFRSWWERIEVVLAVNGEHINGTPIFVKDNTLRVINDDYSYFVPLSKVDYIRTDDGLRAGFR